MHARHVPNIEEARRVFPLHVASWPWWQTDRAGRPQIFKATIGGAGIKSAYEKHILLLFRTSSA